MHAEATASYRQRDQVRVSRRAARESQAESMALPCVLHCIHRENLRWRASFAPTSLTRFSIAVVVENAFVAHAGCLLQRRVHVRRARPIPATALILSSTEGRMDASGRTDRLGREERALRETLLLCQNTIDAVTRERPFHRLLKSYARFRSKSDRHGNTAGFRAGKRETLPAALPN